MCELSVERFASYLPASPGSSRFIRSYPTFTLGISTFTAPFVILPTPRRYYPF